MKNDITKNVTENLLATAAVAAQRAYCPYSHFPVGAALFTADRKIFSGCNVENASYGLTTCAERVAFFSAIAAGATRFLAIAIVTSGPEPVSPCGACLQIMAEFCDPDFKIISAPAKDFSARAEWRLSDMMPKPFNLHGHPKAHSRNAP